MTNDVQKHTEVPFSTLNYCLELAKVIGELDHDSIHQATQMIQSTFDSGKKIVTCGNGGSATTASHYITDWAKMATIATGRRFKGVSLTDNTGLVTAFANDASYENIFSGQCNAILEESDLLIAISGSGNSKNILKALECAKLTGANTLGVLGFGGGKAKELADHSFIVHSNDMQICEDIHLMFGHLVMKHLCNAPISCSNL